MSYETHTAVAVLCSELAHEVSPTLAFLRDLVRSRVLPPLDQSIAEEETARLESIVASLRRTKRAEDATATVALAVVASRAVGRAREESASADCVALDVPDELRVDANERALELMLLSLLRNALRASAGARVTLRAGKGERAWFVAVEDGGAGIPDALADRLFTPLATLGASGRGTGLPIVLRVARDHGWDVAHTRQDGTTIVTVTFAPGDTSIASPP